MKVYSCMPTVSEMLANSKEYKKFINSIWCGEVYNTKKDASEHKKVFEKMFGIKFVILGEEL